jgi:hypothetical protein
VFSQQEAYPAQLEVMLQAKHCNGRVLNAGIDGDTTWGMLNRLERAVPADTRVVILQPVATTSDMEQLAGAMPIFRRLLNGYALVRSR